MQKPTRLKRASSALALLCAAPAAAVGFTPLGDLAGDDDHSRAWALSADGSVVVGDGHSANGSEALRHDGAPAGLGDLAGGIFESRATGASADGSVVVGYGEATTGTSAFSWSDATQTLTPLPAILAGGTSVAHGVSDDGLRVVGASDSLQGREATAWTLAVPVGLGDLAGGAFASRAFAASANGLVVVGESESANGDEAFVWQGTLSGLGDLAGGGFASRAFGVSPDGSRVVGEGTSAAGREAFVWSSSGGLQGLGDLAGGLFGSVAYDVTDAGVAVGASSGPGGPEAVFWKGGPPIPVAGFLAASGLAAELSGWKLVEAVAVSDDGQTVAGWGFDPDGDTAGWVANLPEPASGLPLLCGAGLLIALAGRRRP